MNLEQVKQDLTVSLIGVKDIGSRQKIQSSIDEINKDLNLRETFLKIRKPITAADWMNYYLDTRLTDEERAKTRCE